MNLLRKKTAIPQNTYSTPPGRKAICMPVSYNCIIHNYQPEIPKIPF